MTFFVSGLLTFSMLKARPRICSCSFGEFFSQCAQSRSLAKLQRCCRELNAAESSMLQRAQCCRELNAAESSMLQRAQCYRQLAVQKSSKIFLKWQDHSLEFSALSDLARNVFCVTATGTVHERVFRMDGHAVNSRRGNL